MTNHPMQPIVMDPHGVVRFKANPIVRLLLDYASERGLDLNKLAIMQFSDEDRSQLAQLIGYSVSGYGDLSYAVRVEEADQEAEVVCTLYKADQKKRGVQ